MTPLFPLVAACLLAQPDPARTVGPAPGGGAIVTTGQLTRPEGRTVEFAGRPVDIAVSPDGRTVYAKDNRGLVVVDAASLAVRQEVKFGDNGASMTGLILSPDGSRLWASDADRFIHEFTAESGKVTPARRIEVPGPGGKGASHPAGMALSPDGARILVCVSRRNQLDTVLTDPTSGAQVQRPVDVGVAPFDVVLSPDGATAYVSCWGGEPPRGEGLTAPSSGTPVRVDRRGIAASGGVAVVDLSAGVMTAWVETGLSASGVAISADGSTVYCANANSDTVSVIDAKAAKVVRQVTVRPGDLPFGSMPSALALSPDGTRLYAACAGNNALAVIDLASETLAITGWIPTGWYPGAVVAQGSTLVVANIKGVGSRTARKDGAFNSRHHRGSLQFLEAPGASALPALTARVVEDARVPQVLKAVERAEKASATKPVAVPARAGDPSTIDHIVYIIKENRTYDQVFGDMAGEAAPRGRGKPELCIFGREVTPNHHALTERFLLLDNWYCNGVLSADGHSWATEGNSTPYLERSFGGFTRSYTYGDDPLTYSSSGFVWDHVLAAGLTFRNFGEFDDASVIPPAGKPKKWKAVWDDRASASPAYTFGHSIGIENLRRHSDADFPGWNLEIPDQLRADIFLRKLNAMDDAGEVPNFLIIHLPQDHTMGVTEGGPTPRACVADNDLALGRIIEGLSRTKAWKSMAVFSVEDDPQDGWDHVDGHRSVCIVASPWAKRGAVVSAFYNQTSVIHTMERMLGLTAQNQLYAAAPLMTECFTDRPDFSPYEAVPNRTPLDELAPPKKPAAPKAGEGGAPPSQKPTPTPTPSTPPTPPAEGTPKLTLADLYEITARQDLSRPDQVRDHEFNLVLWHAARGLDAPYPTEWAGPHGKGLPALGLQPDPDAGDDDDDDE